MALHQSSPTDPTLARIAALLAPLALAHGVDVVDVRWVTEHAGRTLRVTIERRPKNGAAGSEGLNGVGWGVSLEDCALVSRDLSEALDRDDFVPGRYNLEVSSPGLDRELHSLADVQRFVGRSARVKLEQPAPDGQRLLRGQLTSVAGPSGAELLSMLVDGKSITVPFANVAEANLVFELAKGVKRARSEDEARTRKPRAKAARAKSGVKSSSAKSGTAKSGKRSGA